MGRIEGDLEAHFLRVVDEQIAIVGEIGRLLERSNALLQEQMALITEGMDRTDEAGAD